MNFLLNKPKLAALVFGLILVLPGPLLLRLTLDNAPESYFPESAPAVIFDKEVRTYFPQDQVLVAIFQGNDIFSRQFLHSLEQLSKNLELETNIERVLSVTQVDHIEPTDDGFAVESLLGEGQTTDSASENLARALSDRFAPNALVSSDGSTLALIIRPVPLSGSLARLSLYNHVIDSIEESEVRESLIAVGGHIALDVAQLRAMIRDLATLIPGTLGVSMLVLWWLFRRWQVLLISALCIGAVTGAATSLLVLIGSPFTLISAIMPPLLTALTVAMLMHLFSALCNADSRGLRCEARMRDALLTVSTPILFTALTTAAGLLSLMASPIQPIASFGLTVGVATLIGALLIVTVLPALLLQIEPERWQAQSGGLRRMDAITSRLLRISLRRPRTVLAVTAAVLLISALQLPRIIVETDLYSFFDDDHPINQATLTIEDKLSGVMPLELIIEDVGPGSLKNPQQLKAIANIEAWLENRPEVDYTISFPAMLSEMHRAFNPEIESPNALPDREAAVDQYLLFYDNDDLYDVVDEDFQRTRILANLNVHGATQLNALLRALDEEVASTLADGLKLGTAGMGRLFADQERLLIKGQINSLFLVSTMITLLMLILWRNLRFVLASILPNFAPVLLIFAVMGTLGIWLDMATAMVASVAIGIAVDDTIHLLHGTRAGLERGAGLTAAIARSVRRRGRALVATTVVLSAQFLLMSSSPFQPTAIFGILTAVGLLIALVFDLLVLPALIVVLLRGVVKN
ncbi:efflux RND transporter permease subunit [Congregibacter litoralis]|uniref:Putative exporter of the RND superfamily n=1 Tax=Congregibacter litoralis KT71 TaxID=314285 RepID=A4A573_9GAMM|nr:MMPL family transporter [Congregibacter litoralis]EAQ98944.1 putative exporter of the RND superfamily [Congregibacter litoralis KT71]